MAQMLIVNNNPGVLNTLMVLLQKENHELMPAESYEQAVAAVQNMKFDAIVVDLEMEQGGELLRSAKTSQPGAALIALAGAAVVEEALEMAQLDVFDYLTKPINPDDFQATVQNGLLDSSDSQAAAQLPVVLQHRSRFGLIAESPLMARLCDQVEQISLAHVPLLITAGAGAELESLLNTLHTRSGTSREMVTVNCADLTEDQLFGKEKRGLLKGGSVGLLEDHNTGTLVLQHVEELPIRLQEMLLEVMRSGKYRKSAKSEDIHIKVRLIFTCSANLAALVNRGTMDRAFVERIELLSMYLPGLSERKADMLPLLNYYHVEVLRRDGELSVTREVAQILEAYSWPGGFAEIRQFVDEVLAPGSLITRDALPQNIIDASGPQDVGEEESTRHRFLKKFLYTYQESCKAIISAA